MQHELLPTSSKPQMLQALLSIFIQSTKLIGSLVGAWKLF